MIKFAGTIDGFTRGWVVGDFEPSLIKTKNIEVAIQQYSAGDEEEAHYHKEAIEYNIILDGVVKFNDDIYNQYEICIIEKDDITKFKAITNARVLVIKSASIKGDKYIV